MGILAARRGTGVLCYLHAIVCLSLHEAKVGILRYATCKLRGGILNVALKNAVIEIS